MVAEALKKKKKNLWSQHPQDYIQIGIHGARLSRHGTVDVAGFAHILYSGLLKWGILSDLGPSCLFSTLLSFSKNLEFILSEWRPSIYWMSTKEVLTISSNYLRRPEKEPFRDCGILSQRSGPRFVVSSWEWAPVLSSDMQALPLTASLVDGMGCSQWWGLVCRWHYAISSEAGCCFLNSVWGRDHCVYGIF